MISAYARYQQMISSLDCLCADLTELKPRRWFIAPFLVLGAPLLGTAHAGPAAPISLCGEWGPHGTPPTPHSETNMIEIY